MSKKKPRKNKRMSIRINREQFDRISKMLGFDGNIYGKDSKVIQTCMNVTENVIQRQFGGDLQHMFKRRVNNIEEGIYEKPVRTYI